MPIVKREDISDVSTIVTVELTQNDYLPKVKQKLREFQQQSSFKGFRPGQTPMTFIRKRFGNSVLMEQVEEVVREAMGNFFKEQKLVYLAQPLPAEENNHRYDIENAKDYTFKFELGVVPEFEIKGTSLDNVLPYYDIAIDEAFLQEEIERLRKRFSTGFEDDIQSVSEEDDMIFCHIEELEGDAVKSKGVSRNNVPFFVRDLNADLKAQVLTAKVGDSFVANIYEVEPKRDKEFVRKHFLQASPKVIVGDMFKLTIEKVQRVKKADLSEDFYQRLFPDGEVKDVDAFQEKMRTELYNAYKQLSMQKFFAAIYDSLMELNQMTLPIEFLKKWLSTTEKNLPANFFETEEFKGMQNDIRWGLVRDRLANQFEIEVTREDVEDAVRLDILRYFNYQIPPYGEYTNNMINRILGDRREFQKRYEAVLDERVLERLSEEVGKDVKAVSKAEFDALTPQNQTQEATA